MSLTFKKATKAQSKARVMLVGVPGAGKTYSALAIAVALGARVAVIDTERGSASKYSDDFAFDVLELDSFNTDQYIAAIHAAEAAGYDVVVIDSLSHGWMGKGGIMEQVDIAKAKMKTESSFNAWRDVTPMQNALVEAMLNSKCHIIATVRQKMDYVVEGGKPRKVGLAPVQRDGLEYEFDVVGTLDESHVMVVTKARCRALDGKIFRNPGADVARPLLAWLTEGAPAVPRPATPAPTAPAPAAPPQLVKEPVQPLSPAAPITPADIAASVAAAPAAPALTTEQRELAAFTAFSTRMMGEAVTEGEFAGPGAVTTADVNAIARAAAEVFADQVHPHRKTLRETVYPVAAKRAKARGEQAA